jgi:hypothetical protein
MDVNEGDRSAIMKKVLSGCLMLTMALIGFGAVSAGLHTVGASGLPDIPVSGDQALIPHSSAVDVRPLASDQTVTTPADAIKAAEEQFGLADSEIDRTIGVVRATVSMSGSSLYGGLKAWVVTADVDFHAPWGDGMFHKLSIVVDATTGKYVSAFTSDEAGGM